MPIRLKEPNRSTPLNHGALRRVGRLAAVGGFAGAVLAVAAAAHATEPGPCRTVVAAEFADSPRRGDAPPRRPEINLTTPGRYCLAEDVRQEKLLDYRGRELAARGGDAIVLVGADDVTLDLAQHTVANGRVPGYTLVRQDRHIPGRSQSHWFTGTVVRNGRLLSPGSTGIGIRLVSAQRYGPRGFGEPAVGAPGQALEQLFADTRHRLEQLDIAAGHRAVLMDGRGNVIRDSRIVVDGYTAIVAQGPGTVIEDNLIEVRADLSGLTGEERGDEAARPFAIRLIQADGAVVRNNRIRMLGSGVPLAAAIELVASRGVTVTGNQMEGFLAAVRGDSASGHEASGNRLRPCGLRGARFTAPAGDATADPVAAAPGAVGIACH